MAVVVVRVHYLGESVQTLLDSDLDEYPVNGKKRHHSRTQIMANAPENKNAPCQPSATCASTIIGGANIAPIENPTPAHPAAMGRSFFGNQSEMALAFAGVAAASALPIKKRNTASWNQVPAPACIMHTTAQTLAQTRNPILNR